MRLPASLVMPFIQLLHCVIKSIGQGKPNGLVRDDKLSGNPSQQLRALFCIRFLE